jgi:hypothetical protein
MSRKNKKNVTGEAWLKVIAGLALALAATAAAGHVPSGPAERPTTTCVTLQALPLAGRAA